MSGDTLWEAVVADDSGRAPTFVGLYQSRREAQAQADECASQELQWINPRGVVRRITKTADSWVHDE